MSDELVDLHLLLNTLSSTSLRSSASASWLPICLPKFNPKGFLYCYVSFLDSISAKEGADGESQRVEAQVNEGDDVGIGLAIVTPDRDGFEKIRSVASVAETVSRLRVIFPLSPSRLMPTLYTQALLKENIPSLLSQAAQASPYPVSDLGITGLLHFVYKSRTLVQITHPQWDVTINQPR